jgi:hypothetical protein
MLNGVSSKDSLPAKDDGEMYASLAGRESGKVNDIFFARD